MRMPQSDRQAFTERWGGLQEQAQTGVFQCFFILCACETSCMGWKHEMARMTAFAHPFDRLSRFLQWVALIKRALVLPGVLHTLALRLRFGFAGLY